MLKGKTALLCPPTLPLQAFNARNGFLQSSYHVQILAMTSQLATPNLLDNYRNLAQKLRWSVLSVKGNADLFDKQFSNTHRTLNATEAASLPPYSNHSTVATTLLVTSGGSAQHRHLMQDAGIANATTATVTAAVAALNTDASGGNSTLSLLYVSTATISSDIQDLLYTLAVAAIIMAIVLTLHAILVLLYLYFVSPTLHPYLTFPRVEVTVGNLIVIALTFYSCLALGGARIDWLDSRAAAIVVITLLTVTSTLLLWFVALARMWVRPQVCMAWRDGRVHVRASGCSMQDLSPRRS